MIDVNDELILMIDLMIKIDLMITIDLTLDDDDDDDPETRRASLTMVTSPERNLLTGIRTLTMKYI